VSRALLIEAYISGLNLTPVAVVGAGRRCRIITGEPAPGETIAHRYFFKPSHVDLLLATIGPEGLSGKPPAALAALIVKAAGNHRRAISNACRAAQGRRDPGRRDRRARQGCGPERWAQKVEHSISTISPGPGRKARTGDLLRHLFGTVRHHADRANVAATGRMI
jgi:hypothetical protein